MIQWLGLHIFTATGVGSIPDRGTKIPHASQCGQKKKNEFVLFPTVHPSLEPKSWPIGSDQGPLTFIFSLSILHRNFHKGLFFHNSPCVLLSEVEWIFHFSAQKCQVVQKNTHHCLHRDERDNVLNFFRAALGYCRMSTEVQSLIERLHICMKAHLRHAKQSPEF